MNRLKTFESFSKKQTCYFRAESSFLGDVFKFEPSGYYEYIDDENNPSFAFGEHKTSDTPEVCASKYIGGCIMGAYSMNQKGTYYIYKICEEPDKDISHWDGQDFQYLEEVRFRKQVTGNYIGKIITSNYLNRLFDAFYIFQSVENMDEDEISEYREEYDSYLDDIEEGKLTEELKKIKV